jgi:hypothetical protein
MRTEHSAGKIMTEQSSIFWNITPCSPLEVNRSFGRKYRLHLQGRKVSRTRNQRESRWQTETFNGIHGVISQKTELFITTTVRTSNPTWLSMIIRKELEINWKLDHLMWRENVSVHIYMVTPCSRGTNIYFGTYENWFWRQWSPQWQPQLFHGK